MIRILLAALLAGVAIVASACGESKRSSGSSSERQLTDLEHIAQLRSLFNTRSGEPRLIVLVSPT